MTLCRTCAATWCTSEGMCGEPTCLGLLTVCAAVLLEELLAHTASQETILPWFEAHAWLSLRVACSCASFIALMP